jgi:uncharacterized protein (DUF736 family)
MATATAKKTTNTSKPAAAKGSKPEAQQPRQYDNNLRGALFSNKRKTKDTQPDYSGNCEVNGTEFYVSGWKQKAQKGELAGKTYISLAVNSKERDAVTKASDDDLRGALFANGRKENDKQPDYTGKVTIGDRLFYVSAWLKESGAGEKYFSLAFRDAEEAKKASEAEPTPAEGNALETDDIPF